MHIMLTLHFVACSHVILTVCIQNHEFTCHTDGICSRDETHGTKSASGYILCRILDILTVGMYTFSHFTSCFLYWHFIFIFLSIYYILCVRVCVCVCVCVCMYIDMYVYIFIYTYIYIEYTSHIRFFSLSIFFFYLRRLLEPLQKLSLVWCINLTFVCSRQRRVQCCFPNKNKRYARMFESLCVRVCVCVCM
jgi:hypothetical protein